METTTPFDLNRAIQQWRESLAQSPAIRAENLDELETHLRDSVATLQTRELSAEEVFLIATKRVGSGAVLGKEFGKVNAVNVWVERCLWTLIIMQLWGVISRAGSIATLILSQPRTFSMTTGLPETNGVPNWLRTAFIIMASVTPIVVATFLIWKLLASPKSRFGAVLEKISGQPAFLAVSVFVVNMVMGLTSILVRFHVTNKLNNYTDHYSSIPLEAYFQFVLPALVSAGLIFVLARKRLLRKA